MTVPSTNKAPEEIVDGEPGMQGLLPGSPIVIPIIEEQVQVNKELHSTGIVQIQKVVRTHEAHVEELLSASTVQVDRVPMNILVDAPPPIRVEGETTVIPVIEEVAIVKKAFRLVEEVRVTRKAVDFVHRENVILQYEEVVVNRTPVSD